MYGSARLIAAVDKKNKKLGIPQNGSTPSNKKKPKMTQIRGLTQAMSNKIVKHSDLHKGGMQSKHIKNMIIYIRAGDSFTVAHNKAKKLDKKK